MKGTLRGLKAPLILQGTYSEPVFEHIGLPFREPIFRRFEISPLLCFIYFLCFIFQTMTMQNPRNTYRELQTSHWLIDTFTRSLVLLLEAAMTSLWVKHVLHGVTFW